MAGRLRQRTAVLTVVALALGMLGLSFQFPAQALAGSTFDATDGNEAVNGAETDWASPPPNLVVKNDSASGSSDSSLSGDEDQTDPIYTLGNIQNNKADLLKIRVA